MSEENPTLAAIDIGTNSIHLIVVRVDPKTGKFTAIDKEKEVVRLGGGSTDMKHLSGDAANRAIATLIRFKGVADGARAPIRAIATSAVREALNQRDFIERVRKETGINVEVVSGVEEARLIYLGVLQALPVFERNILLIDTGGGSTEFLVGRRRKILYDNSLKMGAVRLTERFFASGRTTKNSISAARAYIRGLMNPVVRSLRSSGWELVVG